MLWYTWPNQCTKNVSQHLFGAIHLVRTYLMTNFSTPLSLHGPVHIWDDPVLNGWPISQTENK